MGIAANEIRPAMYGNITTSSPGHSNLIRGAFCLYSALRLDGNVSLNFLSKQGSVNNY